MSKKLNEQNGIDFLEALKKDGYSLNEEDFKYSGTKQMVSVKHDKCGTIYNVRISNFLILKRRCPNPECVKQKKEETNLRLFGKPWATQNEEVLEKIKQKNIEKWGKPWVQQNEEIKKKSIATNIEKWGAPCVLQSNEIREKIKKNNIEKWGFESPMKNEIVKNKVQETNLKNIGVKNLFEHPDFREKMKERYGETLSPFSLKEIREKAKKTKLKNSYNTFISSYEEVCKIKPLFDLEQYEGLKNGSYDFECLVCSSVFNQRIDGTFHFPSCPKCFPKNRSKGEQEVYEFINNLIVAENNKRFKKDTEDDSYSYHELDVFVPSKNIGFEYDGVYYHSEAGGSKHSSYHLEKNSFFLAEGVQVFHVWENEWREKQEIVKSIIKNKLGLTSNKLFARKLTIKEVSKKETKSFLIQNHIQGFAPSKWNYGLYDGNDLKCLLTLDKPRYNKKYEYEIIRFCSLLDTNVIGGFSRLLKHFEVLVSPKSIITYADKRYSAGNVYEKNGFSLSHSSAPNYYYTNNYLIVESRHKFQKHKLKDLLENFDSNKTEWENMRENGYDRIWDLGNYVFVKTFPLTSSTAPFILPL